MVGTLDNHRSLFITGRFFFSHTVLILIPHIFSRLVIIITEHSLHWYTPIFIINQSHPPSSSTPKPLSILSISFPFTITTSRIILIHHLQPTPTWVSLISTISNFYWIQNHNTQQSKKANNTAIQIRYSNFITGSKKSLFREQELTKFITGSTESLFRE